MQDNEKKPALRFKGFTDPWEQRKLDEFIRKIHKRVIGLKQRIKVIYARKFTLEILENGWPLQT